MRVWILDWKEVGEMMMIRMRIDVGWLGIKVGAEVKDEMRGWNLLVMGWV